MKDYDQFCFEEAAICIPLANRRPRMVETLRDNLLENIHGCVELKISPCDNILNRDTHQTINNMIHACMSKRHIKYSIVGEYQPQTHRWHYHGFMYPPKEDTMNKIDKMRRSLVRQIGRTGTALIRNEICLVDYMIKTYVHPIVLNSVQPFKRDCYSTNQFNLNI